MNFAEMKLGHPNMCVFYVYLYNLCNYIYFKLNIYLDYAQLIIRLTYNYKLYIWTRS